MNSMTSQGGHIAAPVGSAPSQPDMALGKLNDLETGLTILNSKLLDLDARLLGAKPVEDQNVEANAVPNGFYASVNAGLNSALCSLSTANEIADRLLEA